MTPDFPKHMGSFEPSKPVGRWVICERLNIYTNKKPCWFHRKMSKLLLGWDWQ